MAAFVVNTKLLFNQIDLICQLRNDLYDDHFKEKNTKLLDELLTLLTNIESSLSDVGKVELFGVMPSTNGK